MKTLTKKTLAAVTFLTVAVFTASANPQKNGKAPKQPCPRTSFMPMMNEYDVLGTVTAVNPADSTITVIDADGKEILVHVNPLTKIVEFREPNPKRKDIKDEPKDSQIKPENKKRLPPPAFLEIKDVKAKDWIAVKKYHNGTKNPEAKFILVKKAQPAKPQK